ncbi:hypothetical protein JVU11DRAFT_4232 [Chiua virens]|nr:hypothetical protein JVU11DRAFT_4232 [Chiua virens]
MLGFAASFTLLTQVQKTFSQVIEQIGMDKMMGLWDTVMSVIGLDLHLLEMNSVVAIFKE